MSRPNPTPDRVGQWLPSDQAVLEGWLSTLSKEVDGPTQESESEVENVDADSYETQDALCTNLHPVMQEFKELIENNAEINMFFHQMFTEVPRRPPCDRNPTKMQPQVRNYHQMLRLINRILTTAPEFNESCMVGLPIYSILVWCMGTTGGYAAFLNDWVNQQLKKILNKWASFLVIGRVLLRFE